MPKQTAFVRVCWWRQRLGVVRVLLGLPVRYLNHGVTRAAAYAGWGRKRSGQLAQRLADWWHAPVCLLEDGFLRSFGTGQHFPPLALVLDDTGIYYDCTRPSALERLLASDTDVLQPDPSAVQRARIQLLQTGLSKYNHAPDIQASLLRTNDVQRILVVDQTAGDMSVALGAADESTFVTMLTAARNENPNATVYVKTHPEVTAGRKGGYLTGEQPDARTVILRDVVNPMSLLKHMDRVYVVSSTMGFEALLAGKPVSVFGMPWYAGWGVTDDRQTDHPALKRRTRQRSVDELFAAAYLRYTRYLNPVTHQHGTIFDVMDWLSRQREMAARYPGRMVAVGFRRWKAANVKPLLSLDATKVLFVPTADAAATLGLGTDDNLVFWGREPPQGVAALAERTGASLLRLEDGFVRSVGLGSDLIAPLSLVLDDCGIYFDPTQPSRLEHILLDTAFSSDELARAAAVRAFMVEHGITKYNLEPREAAAWAHQGRPVVLVPGQVEDDASIRFGCTDVKTNLGLLQAARQAHPDAFVVYKPHPDVMSGNRAGQLALAKARKLADHVETRLSVVSCIEACDVVHTMTSLTGFDALLRGKRVVVYGQPFYAGWGLTDDVLPEGVALARRRQRPQPLMLDELVAGTLLRYPLYWDWDLKGYTTCEAVLHRLLETRTRLESTGSLEKLRLGFVRRQWRKLRILSRAWMKS
ncbi:MAG: capsular polysaccharide biosynthesis protein [Pseudomonadota bacterium]|nr:capsular polysaccharide biosynthesis protein [Pseudomonadota bacterium]